MADDKHTDLSRRRVRRSLARWSNYGYPPGEVGSLVRWSNHGYRLAKSEGV